MTVQIAPEIRHWMSDSSAQSKRASQTGRHILLPGAGIWQQAAPRTACFLGLAQCKLRVDARLWQQCKEVTTDSDTAAVQQQRRCCCGAAE